MPHAARAALTFAAALLCTATCQRFPTGRIEGTVWLCGPGFCRACLCRGKVRLR